ncbi:MULTISPECIES: hypothetical protein [unclassified Microbulbifer]|uniref:hypothetical protein n=1 Tax=unclassified Microbulbifer TaxID=2619833 RepID=UPI00116424BE|nr:MULTISPECIES: hypothetical protein [unclassified Microbulbifer]WHI50265.1 hypothetical protein P3339_17705 [Microbulbifer sp. MLAF003]BBM00186.1 hypothetical protein GL2_02600 [Microbulbifer sp. GL-2]
MGTRNIIFDGEPIRICRYRSDYDNRPMYAICILNYTKYVRSFSVSVGVNLREELELTLRQMREVERSMAWLESEFKELSA